MNELFHPFLRKFIFVFFDDILVYSDIVQQHVEHLEVVKSIGSIQTGRNICLVKIKWTTWGISFLKRV